MTENDYCLLYDIANKRVTDLEKENAELRAKYLQATDEGTSWAHLKSLERKNEKQKNQLTKAKEIIKEYMLYCKGELTHYKDIEEQAEQFLNGENIILEDIQAGNSPFDADKVFNKEMKAYTDEN